MVTGPPAAAALTVVNEPAAGVVAPTVPLMFIEAVPVRFVTTPLLGVPKAGVTRIGLVANTAAPDPVSLVSAAANCAEVNEPSDAALPTLVTAPVRFALVVTVAAFPDMFPVKAAVIVPALKLPEASLITKVEAVFAVAWLVPVIVPFKTAVVRVLLVRVSVVALPTSVSVASGSVYVLVVPVVIPLTWNVAILVGSVSSAIVKVESTAERVAEYTLVASENTD